MPSTKSRSEVVVDKERAREVIGALYKAYMEEKKLFRHVNRHEHAPQRKYFPHGIVETALGGIGHRLWQYFTVMTDRREVSEQVYASHARLSEKYPELYTRDVIKMSPSVIEAILREEQVGSPGQSAEYWPRCAETLYGEFSGDPLNLYWEGSIDALLLFKRRRKVDPIPGFGPKILSLLSLFYEELGLMKMPPDAFPVDVHVQRFAISTGIIRCAGTVVNEHVEPVLRKLLCELCLEKGWSALELSHAIWFLGNRLCSGCYRNKAMLMLCPVYSQCGGSISTLTYTRKGTWDFDAPRHRKGGERKFIDLSGTPLFIAAEGTR